MTHSLKIENASKAKPEDRLINRVLFDANVSPCDAYISMVEYLPQHLAVVRFLVEVIAECFPQRVRPDAFESETLRNVFQDLVGHAALDGLIFTFSALDQIDMILFALDVWF